MWDLPGPGLEPMSPALAGRFLTTVPPGKPHFHFWTSEHVKINLPYVGNKCHLRIFTQFFTSLSLEQHGRSISLCPWEVLQVPLQHSYIHIVSLFLKQSNDSIMKESSYDNNSKFLLSNTKIRSPESCLVQLVKPSLKNGQAWFEMSIIWHPYQFTGTGNYSPPVCLLLEPKTYWEWPGAWTWAANGWSNEVKTTIC